MGFSTVVPDGAGSMDIAHRRVVVTGLGIISPLGNTKEELWSALTEGRSGIGPMTAVSTTVVPTTVAGEAKSFQGEIDDFGPLEKELKKQIRKGLKVMCRECQMGVASAQRALADAGLTAGKYDPLRVGVAFGSDYMLTLPEEFSEGVMQCRGEDGRFVFSRWAQEGMPKMSPLWLLKYLPNMPASHIAIYNDLQGPSNSITLREASPNLSITEATQIIRRGRADIMVCGATGTRLHPMKVVHAIQQEEVARGNGDPSRASRPFDLNRCGMVLGEGAGAVVIEELQTALARGATIYAEILGGGSSSVVGRNLVADRSKAIANAMAAAMRQAGVGPDDIGHVNAHGLSTRTGDAEEARAINDVLGSRRQPVPVVAPKSYFGNLGAGSGVVKLAASVMALRNDRLFRVLNYDTPDPECPVQVVACDGVSPGDSFINVNVTPQAQAGAVVVRRWRE
jgi:3-oxoacyl-[acyl-carrier-protein] synthase II